MFIKGKKAIKAQVSNNLWAHFFFLFFHVYKIGKKRISILGRLLLADPLEV